MKQYLDSIQPENEALVEVILTAGEILIKANAEAYRIEDSLKRMFSAYKCQADIIAQSTSLIATIRFPDQQTITVIRRVNEHQTNLNHVHTINSISRNLTDGKYTLSQAANAMDELLISSNTSRNKRLYKLGFLMLGCSFCLVFKGGFNEFIASFLNGCIYVLLLVLNDAAGLSELMFDLLASLVLSLSVIALTALFTYFRMSFDGSIVLISSIMPMVPGIALTNALRDLLNGDFVSGSNRLLEALVIAGTIAVGIGFGMGIGGDGLWF